MLALAFLNPLLLWAVPLCAVPIVIHLLNRRRFQRVPWAAMEYLLAALKRNRKRLRMEQWLVLLLRTLAVLLLALLVARPQLTGGALLGTRTHHVVLLDNTASMQQRSGSLMLWDKAVDEVRKLADRLGESRGGDLFSLVRTSQAQQPELWAQRAGPDLGRRVGALLKDLPAGDGAMDLGAVLAAAQARAKETKEAGHTEYYLVTDLRTVDWLTEDDKPRPALESALFALDPGTAHLTAIAVGSRDADNLGIVAVRRVSRLTAAGVQLELAVDVQNHGLDASQTTEVAIEMDGRSRTVRPVPQLAPGERVSIPLVHTFQAAGHHRIEASLPPVDHYPLDDRRALVLPVPERSKALLVDGDPGESAEGGETMFLQIALEQSSELPTGIEPQVVTDTALAELDLSPYDVVYLCNVAAPAPAVVDKLEQFVTGGGGLVIFAGSQVDPARYNELLWRGGQGLLPLQFGEIAGDPDRPEHLFLAKADHPLCGDVSEALDVFFKVLVLIKRYLPMVDDPRAPASVVARIRDAEGPPAIVTKTYGSGGGQVVVFGFAADKGWSNWPDTPANLVIAQQAHRFATKVHDPADSNLTTRGTYRLELDPGLYKPDVEVRALTTDGEERTYTAAARTPAARDPGAPAQAAEPLAVDVDMADLRSLGSFEVDLQQHAGGVEKRLFTRNVPLAESRLVRLAAADFARVYPPELLPRVAFRDEGTGLGADSGQGELWRGLALAMLLALLFETLLAWRFGRR